MLRETLKDAGHRGIEAGSVDRAIAPAGAHDGRIGLLLAGIFPAKMNGASPV